MELKITGVIGAITHIPEQKTHVIQICSCMNWLNEYYGFVADPLFDMHKYTFDDVTPAHPGGIVFSEDIAERIITDFESGLSDCETALVHCTFGRNRSPAVGMALNKLFGLGYNSQVLREKFPVYNRWVYHSMMEKGSKMLEGQYVHEVHSGFVRDISGSSAASNR